MGENDQLSQDMAIMDITMDIMVMDTFMERDQQSLVTMQKGRLRLKLNLDTSEEDMVDMAMVDTDGATMERGRLMLSLDTSETDMVDMAMAIMAMEEDIMVQCLFISCVTSYLSFSLARQRKRQKSESFQTSFYFYIHRTHGIQFSETT